MNCKLVHSLLFSTFVTYVFYIFVSLFSKLFSHYLLTLLVMCYVTMIFIKKICTEMLFFTLLLHLTRAKTVCPNDVILVSYVDFLIKAICFIVVMSNGYQHWSIQSDYWSVREQIYCIHSCHPFLPFCWQSDLLVFRLTGTISFKYYSQRFILSATFPNIPTYLLPISYRCSYKSWPQ